MASAHAGGEAATTEAKAAKPVDLNATDSDDDADEDGEALTSGMAVVSMPDGADEEFFGNDDDSVRAPWEDEWEDTFFDGALASWDTVPTCVLPVTFLDIPGAMTLKDHSLEAGALATALPSM